MNRIRRLLTRHCKAVTESNITTSFGAEVVLKLHYTAFISVTSGKLRNYYYYSKSSESRRYKLPLETHKGYTPNT